MSHTNAFAGISFGNPSEDVFKYRDENMCKNWKKFDQSFDSCKMTVSQNPNGAVSIGGKMTKWGSGTNKTYMKYWASAPPTRGYSYSGSALPYANAEIAFGGDLDGGNPNIDVTEVLQGGFNFDMEIPNSYYENNGTKLVPPTVYFVFCDENGNNISKRESIQLAESIAFRSLSWLPKRNWNDGPLYYGNQQQPTRTQEQILRDSAWQPSEPRDGWGLRPPY